MLSQNRIMRKPSLSMDWMLQYRKGSALPLILVVGLLLAGQVSAVLEYKNHNWTEVTVENQANATGNSTLQNLDVYYMANCSASYLLVMANGKPVENSDIALHKDQNRTLPAPINSTTDSDGIMKFTTGMGTAWINASKENDSQFRGNTVINHVPACRQFSVNLKFDCTTNNATVTVMDNGIAVKGVKVMVSPMGVSNTTDNFGMVTFPAFAVDMVFVRVTDGETNQLSVFEINECPAAVKNTTTTKPPKNQQAAIIPSPAAQPKKEENVDILPIILALMVTAIAILIVIRITKMEKNGEDEQENDGEEVAAKKKQTK
jgi:hypothetical protein